LTGIALRQVNAHRRRRVLQWKKAASAARQEKVREEDFAGALVDQLSDGGWAARIAALAAAVMLILPVGAYAGYQYLADSIYGASGNGIAFRGDLSEYEHLEDKLRSAQAQLSATDYARLEELIRQVAALQASVDEAGGQNAMSAEQIQQLKSLE